MICPTCHSQLCRRSRRQGFKDRVLGYTGLRPWRCRTCEGRFYAWLVPARFFFRVHCPGCGNMDLKTVSRDRVVEGWLRWLYRLLRVRAYRCEGCRTRFFSARRFRPIRPTVPRESTQAPPQTGDTTAA